ncbi:VOC family protein [Tabrizicola sp.]|uniref:VOC family protein n=1 Tax=Tabrizicola sp. TaxID=2005166 RepID=UPI003F2BB76E
MTSVHHIALTARSLEKSLPFYDGLLSILGYVKVYDTEKLAAWYIAGQPEILLYQATPDGAQHKHNLYQSGFHHLAFMAAERQVIDHVYDWLVSGGFSVLDPPKSYPDYPGNYYAVFFLDPDGLKFEVMNN